MDITWLVLCISSSFICSSSFSADMHAPNFTKKIRTNCFSCFSALPVLPANGNPSTVTLLPSSIIYWLTLSPILRNFKKISPSLTLTTLHPPIVSTLFLCSPLWQNCFSELFALTVFTFSLINPLQLHFFITTIPLKLLLWRSVVISILPNSVLLSSFYLISVVVDIANLSILL